uniref:NADH dehydrogenase subunit 6 n=1 Tax=Namalycastis abiuma TaxID=862681 RepID=A0A342K7Z4_9ANNE|nr:NADH dehydrogenase subunit 6 [Namalycastis abiuma]AMY15513.1 NADH dehydrogenase subunit 6 [Namalycastis abiuma]
MLLTLVTSCLMALSPISLGVTVLFIALMSSMSIAAMSTTWYGLIMFIIYVGGMLVMFSYFAALQPNQHITNWMWWASPPIFIMFIYIGLTPTFSLNQLNTSIKPLFTSHNTAVLMFLAILLFLALIAVVKTSRSYQGPLRPFAL